MTTIEYTRYSLATGRAVTLGEVLLESFAVVRIDPCEALARGHWPAEEYRFADGVPILDPIVPVITAQMVKDEARRRIIEVYDLGKQATLTRLGGEKADTMFAFIDAVRDASNRVEAMDPIPPDYADNKWWIE